MSEVINLPTLAERSKAAPPFVWTPTAREIHGLIERCRAGARMGLIIGAPGVGKTMALRHAAESDRRSTRLITGSAATGALTSAMRAVASALRDCPEESIDAYELPSDRADQVINWLRHRTPITSREQWPVLIFDEAQHFDDRTLDTLRWIWDVRLSDRRFNSCGLVLCGNETFPTWFNGRAGKAKFAQLTSRISARLRLEGCSRADVLALCDALKIRDAGARDYLIEVAADDGALRAVWNLVSAALERDHGPNLTAAQLRAASGALEVTL